MPVVGEVLQPFTSVKVAILHHKYDTIIDYCDELLLLMN